MSLSSKLTRLSPSSSYGRHWISIYTNTVIDEWFVGDFSSASYHITVEVDSNQKETMQVLVVARPDHASYTVFGRTSIQDDLITLSATVTSSKMKLTASTINPDYVGAKLVFTATYSKTITPLGIPTVVSSSSISETGEPTIVNYSFGVISALSQTDIVAQSESDAITLLSGNGISIATNNTTKTVTFSSAVDLFKHINVGSSTLTADNPNDSLIFAAGTGISLSASALTNTITVSTSGILSSLTVSGNSNLSTLSVTGNSTLNNLTVNGNLTANGNLIINGTTTTVNSTALSITDYNITLAQDATTSQLANGAGISIAGANASLNWDHTTTSWQFNKSVTPSTNNTNTLGTPSLLWQNVYATTLTGTLSTGPQTNITALGSLSTLTVNGSASFTSGFSSSGLTTLQQTQELYVSVPSPGLIATLNFSNSAIYYCTGLSSNFTAAFTNVPNSGSYVLTTTLVLVQGATAYTPTSLSINGTNQTIKWLGGSAPVGGASKINVVSFTFMITSTNTYTVLGNLSEYS
jgi:hypothetical protein